MNRHKRVHTPCVKQQTYKYACCASFTQLAVQIPTRKYKQKRKCMHVKIIFHSSQLGHILLKHTFRNDYCDFCFNKFYQEYYKRTHREVMCDYCGVQFVTTSLISESKLMDRAELLSALRDCARREDLHTCEAQ